MRWTRQEIECYNCKLTTGCKSCSIYEIYKIKNCNLFKYVLFKFAKLGKPREV